MLACTVYTWSMFEICVIAAAAYVCRRALHLWSLGVWVSSCMVRWSKVFGLPAVPVCSNPLLWCALLATVHILSYRSLMPVLTNVCIPWLLDKFSFSGRGWAHKFAMCVDVAPGKSIDIDV